MRLVLYATGFLLGVEKCGLRGIGVLGVGKMRRPRQSWEPGAWPRRVSRAEPVRAVLVEGRVRRALYPLLFAVFRWKRTCRRRRTPHLFTIAYLWLNKYLTCCERPLLALLCLLSKHYVLKLWYVLSCVCYLCLTLVMFWSVQFSATAKASLSKVGWKPASLVLRWAKIRNWYLQVYFRKDICKLRNLSLSAPLAGLSDVPLSVSIRFDVVYDSAVLSEFALKHNATCFD